MQGLIYWIGLDDLATEGRFVWAESHQLAEYTNWRSNQPDDADDLSGEDCVWKTVEVSVKGWNDASCTRTIWDTIGETHALCEFDL